MTDKDKNIKEETTEETGITKESKQPAVDKLADESKKAVLDGSIDQVADTNEPKGEIAVEEEITKDDSHVADLPFIIGTKVGMTQVFSSNGTVYPVSVIQAGPCVVTQIKTNKTDGYNSIQLGFIDKKESKQNKSLLGHYKKSGVSPKKHLKEFKYNKSSDIELGREVLINQFNVGDFLTVTGTSKGKGFAGHMKRHNFSGGRASHGKNSVMRKAGSIGAGTSPGRVWKGTRMAGRMGGDKITTKNLELIKIDQDRQLLFVSGSIPGFNKNVVYISRTNYES